MGLSQHTRHVVGISPSRSICARLGSCAQAPLLTLPCSTVTLGLPIPSTGDTHAAFLTEALPGGQPVLVKGVVVVPLAPRPTVTATGGGVPVPPRGHVSLGSAVRLLPEVLGPLPCPLTFCRACLTC